MKKKLAFVAILTGILMTFSVGFAEAATRLATRIISPA